MIVLPFDPDKELNGKTTALFLDFDGTLIDLALTPQSVRVPPDLVHLMRQLSAAYEGRVCIVTGRPLADITFYLDHLPIDIIAEHGAQTNMREIEWAELSGWPASWQEHLLTLETCIPNLVVERKKTAVAFHYRQQPALEPEVIRFAEVLRNHAPDAFMIVSSNMTTEIRRKGIDKGRAIRAAMLTPRYNGHLPVFIGDDVTDVAGFEAVQEMGGQAYHVGTDFGGQPARVRQWLTHLVSQSEAA
jgi:trehalose 6-phosphate phosphatase